MFCRKTVAGVDLRAAGSNPPPGGTLSVAPEAASGWTTPVALPWAASRPSGSPRSSLHRPCAPAATPQGCPGQSTSPRPRRCRREVELGERRARGIEARGVGKPVLDGFRSGERAAAASTATASAAADPGVVLCVADGIVRIAAGIIRAAVRLSGGIDRLIGVTAGEDVSASTPCGSPKGVSWPPRPAWILASRLSSSSFGTSFALAAASRPFCLYGPSSVGGALVVTGKVCRSREPRFSTSTERSAIKVSSC
jgi:hypothetical protein